MNTTQCDIHQLDLERYCKDCQRALCSNCFKKDHESHKILGTDELILFLMNEQKNLQLTEKKIKKRIDEIDITTKEVQLEAKNLEKSIKEKTALLHQIIDIKVDKILKELYQNQNEKLLQIKTEKNSLTQISNGIHNLNSKSFEIYQTKNNKDLIKCIINSSELQKLPQNVIIPKMDVFYDTFEQIESLQNLKLQPSVDIQACKLEGPLECKKGVDETFSIKAFSRNTTPIPLKINPFTISVINLDSKKKEPKIKIFIDNSIVKFTFLSEETGEYQVRIHNNELDIFGSPFKIFVYEESMDIVLPLPCWYAGTFIQKTQEFLIKSSYTSRQLSVFTKRGAKMKMVDLPCDAIYIYADINGDLLLGNGNQEFIKLNDEMKILWKTSHSKKSAYPICSDGNNVYGYCHDSILVIDSNNGKIISSIPLNHIDEISSLLVYQNEFYISDLFDVKVFNINGIFQRKYECDSCCLTIIDNSVYYCHFNDTNWKKL